MWNNLYPTPTQTIEIFKNSPEMLRILGSESKFVKNFSSLKKDISQKIQMVSIEQNGKLFEKRKSKLQESKKLELKRNSNNSNLTNNIYGIETTKSPLRPFETHTNNLIDNLNRKEAMKSKKNKINNKNIDEHQSSKFANFILNFQNNPNHLLFIYHIRF